ncbi:4-alpha-glucanotransferase [Streptomyces sp. NPDC002285]
MTSRIACDESGDALSCELLQLARRYGIETAYKSWDGREIITAPGTLVKILAAFGVDASTPQAISAELQQATVSTQNQQVPRCMVQRAGKEPVSLSVPINAHVWIELEQGGRLEVPPGAREGCQQRLLPKDIPLGYHTLHVTNSGRHLTSPLISAPARIATPERRSWGFIVQLYSMLSERSWGMGDLADLAELTHWAGRTLKASFILINPLHAMLPASFAGHAPYTPSSRRYPDPVHVRVEAVPEFPYLREEDRARVAEIAQLGATQRAGVLDSSALIDRDAVWALKREALMVLYQGVQLGPGRKVEYDAFVKREGQRLTDFATYCALAEIHGPDWQQWPIDLRSPRSAEIEQARVEVADAVDFHRWLAWITDEQIAAVQHGAAEAGMDIGVVHDLAIGAHPAGADAWFFQDLLAREITVGAPPDAFTAQGQDWEFPPWRPDLLAQSGYAPFAELLRSVLRHAGAVRMDHILGLFRLWWVPKGNPLSEGAYVRYEYHAMLAVLALEAYRANAYVIGEDLGTVEAGVQEQLAEYGVLGTSVLWLERTSTEGASQVLPAPRWRTDCLASLTTHDLPSTASRLSGAYVELHHLHGMLTGSLEYEYLAAAAEVDEWREELSRERLYAPHYENENENDSEGPSALCLAFHHYLSRSPARLLGIWLPDAVGDIQAQNLPGTADEYPNWQLAIADGSGRPVTLEQLATGNGPRLLVWSLIGLKSDDGHGVVEV